MFQGMNWVVPMQSCSFVGEKAKKCIQLSPNASPHETFLESNPFCQAGKLGRCR